MAGKSGGSKGKGRKPAVSRGKSKTPIGSAADRKAGVEYRRDYNYKGPRPRQFSMGSPVLDFKQLKSLPPGAKLSVSYTAKYPSGNTRPMLSSEVKNFEKRITEKAKKN